MNFSGTEGASTPPSTTSYNFPVSIEVVDRIIKVAYDTPATLYFALFQTLRCCPFIFISIVTLIIIRRNFKGQNNTFCSPFASVLWILSILDSVSYITHLTLIVFGRYGFQIDYPMLEKCLLFGACFLLMLFGCVISFMISARRFYREPGFGWCKYTFLILAIFFVRLILSNNLSYSGLFETNKISTEGGLLIMLASSIIYTLCFVVIDAMSLGCSK